VLRFFRRKVRPTTRSFTTSTTSGVTPRASGACALAHCQAGVRAMVLTMACGEADACRLRALGLCEGASVSVVDRRHCMLLEVRGARLALGAALTAGITVLPTQG
jgi:Fe2+ transport system protein FeoA